MKDMLNDEKKNLITQALQALVQGNEAVGAALAVSVDGHLVAGHAEGERPIKRLATMGSTLMSLGDTISRELAMGECNNVIAENESGTVVFMHINKELVLVSLTDKLSSLGMLLSASRHCAQSLQKQL